jgi:hypothetical protein
MDFLFFIASVVMCLVFSGLFLRENQTDEQDWQ